MRTHSVSRTNSVPEGKTEGCILCNYGYSSLADIASMHTAARGVAEGDDYRSLQDMNFNFTTDIEEWRVNGIRMSSHGTWHARRQLSSPGAVLSWQ